MHITQPIKKKAKGKGKAHIFERRKKNKIQNTHRIEKKKNKVTNNREKERKKVDLKGEREKKPKQTKTGVRQEPFLIG